MHQHAILNSIHFDHLTPRKLENVYMFTCTLELLLYKSTLIVIFNIGNNIKTADGDRAFGLLKDLIWKKYKYNYK